MKRVALQLGKKWRRSMLNLFRRDKSQSPSADRDADRLRDLDAILSLTLPSNLSFEPRKDRAEMISGMFSIFSMAVIDLLLDYQNTAAIVGDMLEIGVFKGKSA